MNCKPGEMAINVSGLCHKHRGEIYLVLRAYDGPWIWDAPREPSWWVEHRGGEYHCCDSHLRPIRPGDISEEEVRDLFSPVKEEAL